MKLMVPFFFVGGTMPKDEAQLKAPTDLSMFERLKGTLREILTKELASQVCIISCLTIIYVKSFNLLMREIAPLVL